MKFLLKCILYIVFFFSVTNVLAQETMDEIAPKSPEADGFLKYGEYQLGLYNGSANISVPLYNVVAGNISVPIDLTYQSNAIKVDQESSWVGLGWDLNIGGCINQIVIGGNDRKYNGSLKQDDWIEAMNYITEGQRVFFGGPTSYMLGKTYANKYSERQILVSRSSDRSFSLGGLIDNIAKKAGSLLLGLQTVYSDKDVVPITLLDPSYKISDDFRFACVNLGMGELDIYDVSIPGRSFKFVLTPENGGKPYIIGKDVKCAINFDSFHNFCVTDENGTVCHFDKKEYGIGDYYFEKAWYLTRIISTQKDTVTFNYSTDNSHLFSLPPIKEKLEMYKYPASSVVTSPFTDRQILPSDPIYNTYIETHDEMVVFNTTKDRSDLKGGRKLRGIKIFRKTATGNVLVKDYLFNTSYFTSSIIGGNYLADDDIDRSSYYPVECLSKRLRLDNIQMRDKDTSVISQYSFAYNQEHQLPLKSSFSRDHWGYFNGKENYSTIIGRGGHRTLIQGFDQTYWQRGGFPFSTIADTQENQKLIYYVGANRGASKEYITTWMLKSIQYPTGGKTVFEFEPHELTSVYNYYSAEDLDKLCSKEHIWIYDKNRGSQYTDPDQLVRDLVLTDSTRVYLTANIDLRGFSFNQAGSGTYVQLINIYGQSFYACRLVASEYVTSKAWSTFLDLPPGSYKFICSSEPSVGELTAPLAWGEIIYSKDKSDIVRNAQRIGNGVRISKISNFMNDSLVAVKTINYSKQPNLMMPVDYSLTARNKSFNSDPINGTPQIGIVYGLSSNNEMAGALNLIGNTIGYDTVIVTNFDAKMNNRGFELSVFRNNQAFLYFDSKLFPASFPAHGDIKEKLVINNQGKIVQHEVYEYEDAIWRWNIMNCKIVDVWKLAEAVISSTTQSPDEGIGRYQVTFYPHYTYWNYLKKKTVTNYSDKSNDSIQIINNYLYRESDYALIQESEGTSLNKNIITEYKYPVDFKDSSDVFLQMNFEHVFSPVIQKTTLVDNETIKKQFTNYAYWKNSFYAPSEVLSSFGDEPLELDLKIEDYDSNANILGLMKKGDQYSSFFWATNHSNLLAQISNYKIYDLNQNLMLKEKLSSLENYTSKFGLSEVNALKQLNKEIRDLIPSVSSIVTYTYNPLWGVTSQTDPSGHTTYYEYDPFGRLEYIKDQDGHILNKYEYKYATQP